MILYILFVLLLLVVVYPYLVYPLILPPIARAVGRPAEAREWTPRVAMLLAAHNEEGVLARKLDNALALDYPPELLEIRVGSDGSDDGTAAIARAYAGRGVHFHDFKTRRGKAAVISDLASASEAEVFLFTDASALVRPDALRRMTALLGNAEVGAVSGQMVPWHGEGLATTLDAYRRIDNHLRRHESLLHSSMGAAGAFYGIRRELYAPPAPGTILDDFVIPMRVIEQGRRLLVSDDIAVAEIEATTLGGEFRRKVRTLAGNYQALRWLWRLLLPFHSPVWWTLWSHKVLRLATPFAMLALLAVNVLLVSRSPAMRLLLAGQVGFYLAAACGGLLRGRRRPIALCHYPWLFVVLQTAGLVAGFRQLFGRVDNKWQRSGKQDPAGGDAIRSTTPD